MSNKYAHKLVFTLLRFSPYIKTRLNRMAINQGIFQPPGNFNLIDYTTPWLDQLEPQELEKMMSPKAHIQFKEFYSALGPSKGTKK